MIPLFILNWVEGKVGAKFAKPLIWLAAVLLIALAVWGAFKIHDSRVIAAHDAGQQVATVNADKKADDQAGNQRRSDDARLTNESAQLNGSITHAQTNLARQLAFQHCLRAQQSARAAKRQPPACS